jgi:2'-5' RNA ligase
MKLMSLVKQILQEKKGNTYEYGCAMLYFNFPEIKEIHSLISKGDLYEEEGDRTYGLETEPHTTLLFGLHNEVGVEDVTSVLDKFTFSTCIINTPSLFKNEKYDVLKFDVKGPNLHKCNTELRKFPHTNTFDYHPHFTIAYVKSGLGQKYVEEIGDREYSLVPKYAIYSQPDGAKTKIYINVD